LIIFATGYVENVPFLPKNHTFLDAYKLVFDPRDPSLCYIGTARPMIGSIPGLGELQARWAAKVYTNQATIPSSPEMLEQVKRDKVTHSKIFIADHRSLPQLVNHWNYSDEIASYFGAKPDLVRWFFRNPFRWWTIISAPWSAHIYRVEDPKTRELAIKHIEKTWLRNHYPFRFFNYTMLIMDIAIVGFFLCVLLALYYYISRLF